MLKPGTVAARNSCAYSSWRSPEKGGVERMFTLQLLFPLALLLSYWMAGQLERLYAKSWQESPPGFIEMKGQKVGARAGTEDQSDAIARMP